MVPQSFLRVPSTSQWSSASATGYDENSVSGLNRERDLWISAFSARFAKLRPSEDEEAIVALSAELWPDLGGHDPVIAAEMEHEASAGG